MIHLFKGTTGMGKTFALNVMSKTYQNAGFKVLHVFYEESKKYLIYKKKKLVKIQELKRGKVTYIKTYDFDDSIIDMIKKYKYDVLILDYIDCYSTPIEPIEDYNNSELIINRYLQYLNDNISIPIYTALQLSTEECNNIKINKHDWLKEYYLERSSVYRSI